jgi:histidinol-phosphate/aromatic aminotransferase/cobyric acid decarboxylase-like protein
VAAYCAAGGVLVRDCSNFPACNNHHLRVAVTTPEEQEKLFEVLEPALRQ